jgi:hypothetical protein
VSYVDLVGKSSFVVGRAETCDVQLETASISRKHAVIQHRGGGIQQGSDEIFIFDLGSTSGTFLNSQLLGPKAYYALQPGDVLNFASSPDFVLCGGPNNYQPPLPIVQAPLQTTSLSPRGPTIEDEMDALIHARCSDHLVDSLATLERLFQNGQILDEEYYKKKALIQDAMARQQEENRVRILKKKAEARSLQYLEDETSRQKARQQALKQQSVQAAADSLRNPAADSEARRPTVTAAAPGRALDSAFSSALSKGSGKQGGQFATLKMDPKSADFDATAYKRMMMDQYEQQTRDNELRLRLRKLGDPASSEFNPTEYKRLMVEKYEHDARMEQTRALLAKAKDSS